MKSTEAKFSQLVELIAFNIKRLRKERGFSQSDMAKFGLEKRNYQRLEAGNHSPSLYTLHKLAEALESDMREFFRPRRAPR